MKLRFFSALILLSLAVGVAAQKADVVEQNLRANVAYLASPELEGRRTGDKSATVAAGYVANLFARYKLKPGVALPGGSKPTATYMQRFPYTTGVEPAPTGNSLSLMAAGAAIDSKEIETLRISPNSEARNAPVVFAGYGIEAPESNYNDYAGLDVTGKIVLAFDGNPDDSGRSPFSRFTLHAKAKLAKDKGAVGLILISREAVFSDDANRRVKYDQSVGEAAVPVFAISRGLAASWLKVSEADLKNAESLTRMKRGSALRIGVGFPAQNPSASFSVNLVKTQTDAYNVIGILEGHDPKLRNEAIVIGAHYDHLGRGGRSSLAVNSTDIHHGADDNASGTSAMLELARQFAAEKKNKRTIIFIGFGAEEEGLIGSKHYTNNPVFPLEQTVAMINLDMVGRLTDGKLTVGGIGTSPDWKTLVEAKNVEIGAFNAPSGKNPPKVVDTVKSGNTGIAPMGRLASPAFNLQLNNEGLGPSDHASFYLKNIPVLFLFTGTHADYHKPSDTADKVNYAGLAQIVRFVGSIARTIDQIPVRPQFTAVQSTGQGEGRRGFAVTIGVVPGYGESNDGMPLDAVRDGTPAALAGIKAGDKIVMFAGREIRNIQDYTLVLGDLKADVEYDIVVVRNGQRIPLKVKPAKRQQ